MLSYSDVLVLNESKVFPARHFGKNADGKDFELLVIHQLSQTTWRVISHPGLRVGMILDFPDGVRGEVVGGDKISGEADVVFSFPHETFFEALSYIGKTPVPSYIHSSLSEEDFRRRYQTVFAKNIGSVAAPTAGLHFTDELLTKLRSKSVQIEYITLHVGLGTFQALREEHFRDNALHEEYVDVSPETARRLNDAKKAGKRIIAVGTTTTRTLESLVDASGFIQSKQDKTKLFIYPPYQFRFVDSMITNFHLPKSSLLMLISAFFSFPNTPEHFVNFPDSLLGKAYQHAIKNNYRFYSFGDAMWIV